jgi:hypothetical protein
VEITVTTVPIDSKTSLAGTSPTAIESLSVRPWQAPTEGW